jgi:hypothetical protein
MCHDRAGHDVSRARNLSDFWWRSASSAAITAHLRSSLQGPAGRFPTLTSAGSAIGTSNVTSTT